MTLTTSLRRHWKWFTAGGLVLLVAGGFTTAALMGVFSEPVGEAAPKPTSTITATPTPQATPAPAPAPTPAAEVVIDTTQVMPYSEVWNPPDEGESFWQIVDPANGYPEDGGTDYLLAHACEQGGCAGDGIRALVAGDHFAYRGAQYVVEQKLEINKADIGAQPIWEHVPGRVVVITCILNLETKTFDENDIIVASPVA